jgi:DnaJ-domain-containing protein 1
MYPLRQVLLGPRQPAGYRPDPTEHTANGALRHLTDGRGNLIWFCSVASAGKNAGPRRWHEVLQVSPDADPSVIRAAYRNLAAKYHPDNPDSGNQDKFLEVQRAFQEAQS